MGWEMGIGNGVGGEQHAAFRFLALLGGERGGSPGRAAERDEINAIRPDKRAVPAHVALAHDVRHHPGEH